MIPGSPFIYPFNLLHGDGFSGKIRLNVPSIFLWLDDPTADPVVLLDAYHAEGVVRISNQPFTTGSNDSPANAAYDDLISDDLQITAEIGANRSIGSIEFSAMDGEWLNEWTTYSIKLGDSSWTAEQFYTLSSGIIESGIRSGRNQVTLEFSDYSNALLSPALTAMTVDALTPLALGNVFNASPVLEDALMLKYRASLQPCAIVAVRDNGVPVASYTDHGDGCFTLGQSQTGDITCDIIDSRSSVLAACQALAEIKGLQVARPVNFGQFQFDAEIGIYISGNDSVLSLMSELCSSIGAFPRFSENGELELVFIPFDGPAERILADDDVWADQFNERDIVLPANINLNWRKNWTTQSNLAGAVGADNRELYGREYSVIRVDNGYHDNDVQEIDTLLSNQSQAEIEASRRAELYSKTRRKWYIEAAMPGMWVSLGQRIGVDITDTINMVGTVISWNKRPSGKSAEIGFII